MRAWTREYRHTFNTYDDVGDEQFFCYPALPGLPFVAVKSWVPPAQQRAASEHVLLSELTFHCYVEPDEGSFHFRDGWRFAPRSPRPGPPPPARSLTTTLLRFFRQVVG